MNVLMGTNEQFSDGLGNARYMEAIYLWQENSSYSSSMHSTNRECVDCVPDTVQALGLQRLETWCLSLMKEENSSFIVGCLVQ